MLQKESNANAGYLNQQVYEASTQPRCVHSHCQPGPPGALTVRVAGLAAARVNTRTGCFWHSSHQTLEHFDTWVYTGI